MFLESHIEKYLIKSIIKITMQEFIDRITEVLVKELKLKTATHKLTFDKMITQPREEFGDLTVNCLMLNSIIKSDLKRLTELISKLLKELEFVDKVEVINGYVNIYLKPEYIADSTLKRVLDKRFTLKNPDNANKKILIEHTSINPSGPVNVGRIRNSFIGDTLVRIYKELGFDVRTHYYVNDVGKQVAIITWAKQSGIREDEGLKERFEKYAHRPDFKTMFIYVPANKRVQEDKKSMQEIDKILEKCESGDEESLNMLRETAEYCLEGQKKTLERFGIKFDSFDFESDFLKSGDTQRCIERLKKLPEHVVIDGNHALNLEKYGYKSRFGGVVFQRKNKTSVYVSRDVAYHIWKKKRADKLINVLGEDHKVEFKVLKQILKLLDVIKNDDELEVVHFAFVNLKEGKLSTRAGRIVPVDEVLDIGIEKVKEIMSERITNYGKKHSEVIAEKIAASAIRYFELKVAPQKQIIFDWNSALNFEGQTSPYIQYALVRAKKIIKKSGIKEDEIVKNKDKIDFSLLKSKEEKELIKKISVFKSIVEQSAVKKAPHIIANYSYELCDLFSKFYEKQRVISEVESLKKARLAVIIAFKKVISKAMKLLGIEELDEM